MDSESERHVLIAHKPYVLVIHPESGNSAVFNRNYELVAEEASVKLIGTGVKRHTTITRGFTFTLPH